MVQLLLSRGKTRLLITEDVLGAAAKKADVGSDVVKLFSGFFVNSLEITNDVLRVASRDVKQLLLSWKDPPFTIAHDLVTVIVSSYEISSPNNKFNARKATSHFIRGHNEPIIIDAHIIHIIADLASQCLEEPSDDQKPCICYVILRTLLACKQDKIALTEDASRAIAECFPDKDIDF
jgi:hypothetical protein